MGVFGFLVIKRLLNDGCFQFRSNLMHNCFAMPIDCHISKSTYSFLNLFFGPWINRSIFPSKKTAESTFFPHVLTRLDEATLGFEDASGLSHLHLPMAGSPCFGGYWAFPVVAEFPQRKPKDHQLIVFSCYSLVNSKIQDKVLMWQE